MGKYDIAMKEMIDKKMEVKNANNNFLKYIANELAEANRLKRLELLLKSAHYENNLIPIEELEDRA